MGASPTQKAKKDTFDATAKMLTGVLAGMKINMGTTKTVMLGGVSTPVSQVTSDFQGFIDKNTSVDAAKVSLAQEVADRKQLQVAVKKELADFTSWAVVQFGPAAYAMFGLDAPKAKKASPSKTAIGIAKRQAKASAKAAALAMVAPKEESFVALDTDGNPIGATAPASPAPSANPTPAAPAPTLAPASGTH